MERWTTSSSCRSGHDRPRNAALPRDNWLRFDDEPLTLGWGGVEPDDRDSSELNHEEQLVRIEKGKPYFQDSSGTGKNGAVCECDGKAVAAAAADAITANRPT